MAQGMVVLVSYLSEFGCGCSCDGVPMYQRGLGPWAGALRVNGILQYLGASVCACVRLLFDATPQVILRVVGGDGPPRCAKEWSLVGEAILIVCGLGLRDSTWCQAGGASHRLGLAQGAR